MRKDDLLYGFYKYRIEKSLDEYVSTSKTYNEAEQGTKTELSDLEQMGFTDEQWVKVDRIVSAYNYFGAVYGEEAYKFGFWDGVRLMRLLHSK